MLHENYVLYVGRVTLLVVKNILIWAGIALNSTYATGCTSTQQLVTFEDRDDV